MKIHGFEVNLNLPGRQNIWALFLLTFSLVSLAQGVMSTHWMVSYRKGDSIIPRQEELSRAGPFTMTEIKTRNADLVGFASPDGRVRYEEDAYDLSVPPDTAINLVNKYSGYPIAYLSIYKNNPIRQIWAIDADGIEMLSYKKSISNYKIQDSSRYSWFWSFAVFTLWFSISILDVQRVRKIS